MDLRFCFPLFTYILKRCCKCEISYTSDICFLSFNEVSESINTVFIGIRVHLNKHPCVLHRNPPKDKNPLQKASTLTNRHFPAQS